MSRPDKGSPASHAAMDAKGRADPSGLAIASHARRILGTAPKLPLNWRERLPEPSRYYAEHLTKLGKPNAAGHALALCPFHDDHSPSFGVKLNGRGLWRCYAECGQGDIVEFHQRLTGLGFKAAVRELIGGSR
ncbi:MAG: CHC2 zinc finger domain-containing protein [Rhodanobacter sp.]